MKKLIIKIGDCVTDTLRSLCGRISPDHRIVVIVSMCLLFAALNIFITVKSIYNIGREDARRERIDINAIELPEVIKRDTIQRNSNYLLNQKNTDNHER